MASPYDPPDDPNDPNDPDERNILSFTPAPGAKIENLAPEVIKTMERLEMDAEIHFPHFTLDVPLGATAKDIIDAYNHVTINYLPDVRPPPKPPQRGPRL